VADEQGALEVFVFEQVQHVGGVQFEVDVRAEQVVALAQAGEGGGVDQLAARAQIGGDAAPKPAAGPCAVDEDDCCHSCPV
jgi:hypothetical protein